MTKRTRASVVALLALHAAWLAWSATWQSPTLDEPGHLASGLVHWRYGRFEPYRVNPPLVRMLAALPVMAAGDVEDWQELSRQPGDRPEFALGAQWVHSNRPDSQELFVLARWGVIPLGLLGGWLCFSWAHALYGTGAGIGALALWCCDPNLIAHGQLLTPDMGATAAGLAASYAYWRWLARPSLSSAGIAAAGLALALLTKLSWLLLIPLWPALWLAGTCLTRTGTCHPLRCVRRRLPELLLIELGAIYLVNLGYGFDGSGTQLDQFKFVSQSLSGQDAARQPGNRFRGSWIGRLPVPLPAQFLLGIDLQRSDLEQFPRRSFLHGEWRQGGWWYYYLYAAAIKVPLGVWLIGLTALLRRAMVRSEPLSRENRLGEFVLYVPAGVLFVAVSAHLAFNHHFRYVLPSLGPALVFCGSAWKGAGTSLRTWLGANLVWAAVSSAAVAPWSLSYFNELVGGPSGGHYHLLHSNVDWGQGLVALRDWSDRHPQATPLFLLYSGFLSPADLGLNVRRAPTGLGGGSDPARETFVAGWYAIGVNALHGDEWGLASPDIYRPLLDAQPVARCGGSIYVYWVDDRLAAELNSSGAVPKSAASGR